MKKVNWKWDYGVYVPFCPYCDEPAYEKDHCCFCNKPYEWVNGELISHISCTKKFNKTELKELLVEEVNFMQKLFKGEVEE